MRRFWSGRSLARAQHVPAQDDIRTKPRLSEADSAGTADGVLWQRLEQFYQMLSFNKNTVRGARAALSATLTENRAQNTVKNTVKLYCKESEYLCEQSKINELRLIYDMRYMICGLSFNEL
ncbi:hypothetical protein [Sphingopyxis sp. 550A]|jgi:hypothetical protein